MVVQICCLQLHLTQILEVVKMEIIVLTSETILLKVDGGWTKWSRWSICKGLCGYGEQERLRSCTNPKPIYGGKDCYGYAKETRKCDTGRPCPGMLLLILVHTHNKGQLNSFLLLPFSKTLRASNNYSFVFPALF